MVHSAMLAALESRSTGVGDNSLISLDFREKMDLDFVQSSLDFLQLGLGFRSARFGIPSARLGIRSGRAGRADPSPAFRSRRKRGDSRAPKATTIAAFCPISAPCLDLTAPASP